MAAAAGTRILFATPHVHAPWDTYPWSDARARQFDESFAAVQAGAAAVHVDLRRGAELFPSEVLRRDPAAFRLEGTDAVLVEFPGSWLDLPGQVELVARACARIEAHGLVPVLAHPERCSEVADDPLAVASLAERGALLCLNAPSLVGGHGRVAQQVAWTLLDAGLVALVASDGHRAPRPPAVDDAWRVVVDRVGEARARPLFDGSRLPWLERAAAG